MLETSRRRFIFGSAAAFAVTGLGVAIGSREARAQVTGELVVQDATFEDEDGELYAPWLKVTGDWQYSIDGTPDTWEVKLVVVDTDGTRAELDMDSGSLAAQSDSGAYSVVGRVTDADFYSASDFTAGTEGESKTVTLDVLVLFFVRNGPTILAKDRLRDSPTITVKHVAEAAVAGGEGQIGAQKDEGDEPPF